MGHYTRQLVMTCPPSSDTSIFFLPTAQISSSTNKHLGGRVLVFVMGAFVEMPGDVSRICDIIAHDLARIHVP